MKTGVSHRRADSSNFMVINSDALSQIYRQDEGSYDCGSAQVSRLQHHYFQSCVAWLLTLSYTGLAKYDIKTENHPQSTFLVARWGMDGINADFIYLSLTLAYPDSPW